ncbi:MAG: GNAT family N-acetyltransferase [Dehalococcoidia bacterium]
MNSKPSISIRLYEEGDDGGIFDLNRAIYPEDQTERSEWIRKWHWQFDDSSAGKGKIWLAEHGSKIVGQYPLIFTNVKIQTETLRASQNVDLKVHPAYRHQGIFPRLEKRAFSEMEKEGIHITVGFANELSRLYHIKSGGWFDINTLQVFINPLNWENALNLRVGNRLMRKVVAMGAKLLLNGMFYRTENPPFIKGLIVNQINSFDERFDEFWIRVSNQYNILVVRNKEYLNWRYSTPGVTYTIFSAEISGEVHGYLVMNYKIRNSTKLCNIFDAMACSIEILHNLVFRAIEVCRQQNVDLIRYSLIANKAHHQVLRDNGFILFPVIKGEFFVAHSNLPSISQDFLKDPDNWLVQIGDSDSI